MWKRWLELNGTLETAEEINAAITEQTGDPEPWADPEDVREEWKAWVEYENGKTYILEEEVRA